jgi:enoyl-CoA hydratase/carnithine racemase
MSASPVLWSLDARGVATVTLNRPEVNNAYDGALIAGVLAAIDELSTKPVRVVVLKGNGKHFQAGADLKWINGVRPKSPDENEAASRATFEAVQRLNTLPVPTVALVQGGCFGGGTGVISACDIVIAGRQRAVLDHRSALGPDGGDHHPATLRRHRRPPGAALRTDRRTVRRRGRAPYRSRP